MNQSIIKINYRANCKYCNEPLEDRTWTFCSILCSKLSYELTELYKVSMDHIFTSGENGNCSICQFDYFAHTEFARCSKCDKTGSCNVIHGELLCSSCEKENQVSQLDQIRNINEVEKIVKGTTFIGITAKQELINAKIMSIEELRVHSDSEEAFIQTLTARFKQLTAINHENDIEKLQIAQKLRNIGALAREEVRNKLREADLQYKPEPPKKVKAPTSKKLSPMEKLIQTIAISKGIEVEEARKLVMSNPDFVNSLTPGED